MNAVIKIQFTPACELKSSFERGPHWRQETIFIRRQNNFAMREYIYLKHEARLNHHT